ncbi:hypothetical protein HYH82_03675 [Clostridium botulinum]|nr:hypothetical protein [Clostridium botulinum]MBY6756417.1 hypothetical protein [Clostridium botulinum]MBY6797086.1 hypothetical protein [Clostridium botulinum]MBY6866492.1 hypothetical protein [Clostridium botulinum]
MLLIIYEVLIVMLFINTIMDYKRIKSDKARIKSINELNKTLEKFIKS